MKNTLIVIVIMTALFVVDLPGNDWYNSSQQLAYLSELYRQGEIDKLEQVLNHFEPVNDNERGAKLYYQARITIQQEQMLSLWKELIENYPQTEFGQRGLLELAKIAFLERQYRLSRDYLQQIGDGLPERDFFLSAIFLKINLFPEAILSARKFISVTDDERQKELAYLNIVEANILNRRFQQALDMLHKMRSEKYIVDNGCVVTFKEGYCLEMLDRIEQAVSKYKQVITHYPYTEHSYQAEQRLYELTIAARISSSELTTIAPVPGRADRTVVTQEGQIAETVEYFYVQVNAFSEEANARNHSLHLRRSGFENIIIPRVVRDQNLYAVAVGPFKSRAEASEAQKRLKDRLNLDSFIIRHEN